jgi:peroxiredoxin
MVRRTTPIGGALRLLFLIACLGVDRPGRAEDAARPETGLRFPRHVRSIAGQEIDLLPLAERKTLVVITLKATWCPVCQEQLRRIQERRADFEPCGVTFLVLGPGPRQELAAIQDRLRFPYPFVEDVDLTIARRLGLAMSEMEIVPAILTLNRDLAVTWVQRGRTGGAFSDAALLERVGCRNAI